MIAGLIARFGLARVIGAGVLLLAVLWFGGVLGFSKIKAWYYEGKSERLEVKLKTSRAETKVARQDEAQVTKAAEITDATVTAQDNHAAEARAATKQSSEIIYEIIKADPAPVDSIADTRVLAEVDKAQHNAQAALDRLQGPPTD